jgi:hypothetical protein
MSKNKTQTISISTLVKKVIITFMLFNDLPLYIVTEVLKDRRSFICRVTRLHPQKTCLEIPL